MCVCVCQLLDIIYREETLLNVIRSVTKNGRSILLTAVLGVILVYLFSIVGFVFFRDDFMIEVDALDAIGVKKGQFICFFVCLFLWNEEESVCSVLSLTPLLSLHLLLLSFPFYLPLLPFYFPFLS